MDMDWQSRAFETNQPLEQVVLQEGTRVFMNRVYSWMVTGLVVTGAVSLYTASSPALARMVFNSFWLLLIAQFGAVIALGALAPRLSKVAAGAIFLAYSALTGLTLSFIFFRYQMDTIGLAFFITAGSFGALSAYGTVTKKDLSAWGTFLFMGLVGVVIAGVANIFIKSDGLMFVQSCACVVVFAGLTAYDTQKLRAMAAAGLSQGGNSDSLAINGALTLYLDFINLFLAILRLLGRRR
jgi:uncharacterized protein